MIVRTVAPAKINWTLEVLGWREDGYHEIRTVMQTIDLCDELTLAPAETLKLEVEGECAPSRDDDALQAARALAQAAGWELPTRIRMRKRIPLRSGLGGGSSDAAAVLRGLNALYDLGFDTARLADVAAAVGSDCPFFAYGGTALAEGRGERVTVLPDLPQMWLLVAVPPLSLEDKTKRMYGSLQPADFTDGSHTTAFLERMWNGDKEETAQLFNVFERAAFRMFAGLDFYRDALLRAGVQSVHLDGAGPGLFSLCESRRQAEGVKSGLRLPGASVFVARTLRAAQATLING